MLFIVLFVNCTYVSSFPSVGNFPSLIELLNRLQSEDAITSTISFNSRTGILSGPVALLASRPLMTDTMSIVAKLRLDRQGSGFACKSPYQC